MSHTLSKLPTIYGVSDSLAFCRANRDISTYSCGRILGAFCRRTITQPRFLLAYRILPETRMTVHMCKELNGLG